MRPLELIMTAFGSYAGETVIRFSDLDRGLYLVTGDTGAGKTTIFDAIMFALYGRASGRDRDNNPELLHSDYVPKSVDTVVKLTFLQNDRECVVTRSIHFPKKRGGEGYQKPKLDAELMEPDRPAIRGAENVTARCETLLGLNAEQFRKIIMLAQGEFREFLKADSNKKGEILGKLFDSAPYRWFQTLLCRTRDELGGQREAARRNLESLMETAFRQPEDIDGDAMLLYSPRCPELLDNLNALIRREDEALGTLREALRTEQDAINRLNTQRGEAQSVNDQLERLEGAAEHMAALEAEQDACDQRKRALELAERALHRAMPAILSHSQAEESWNRTRATLDQLRWDIVGQSQALEEARLAVAHDEPARERVEALKRAIERIDEQAPLYDELSGTVRARDDAAREAERARGAEAESREESQRVQRDIGAIRERLDALTDIDALTVLAENDSERKSERLDALTGIRRSVGAVSDRERAFDRELEALRECTAKASTAQEAYSRLYQRFIAGQAGLLAEDLRARVEADGEARCPVCGTRVRAGQLEGLAPRDPETPDKKAVDRARAAFDACEEARNRQARIVEGLKSALEKDRAHAVEAAAQWLADGPSWERLRAAHYLEAAIASARQEVDEAAELLRQRRDAQTARDAERAKLPAMEQRLRACEKAISDSADMASKRETEARILDEKVEGLLRRLDYGDKAQAEAQRRTWEAERDALTDLLEAHQRALTAAEEALNHSRGQQSAMEKTLEEQAEKRDLAQTQMDAMLKETGFRDAVAVREALSPMGGQDGEKWLKAEQKAQLDYENEKRNTRKQIDELTAQTAGRQRVDLQALEAQIMQAQERWNEKNEACTRRAGLLANHRDVAAQVKTNLQLLEGTQAAWERIDRLAVMAKGSAGVDGVRSFEKYVLGAAFREILEMANRRLDQMSGGRYELVLKDGAKRANAASGLDIDVMDYSTNQQRASESLSGGEAFFTSLALALGLSDVVQNHAGGWRLDALFIDEGFGTLSGGYLDKALEVLNQLTEGDRLVGIISHVDKLDESIPQKIRVHNGGNGSTIEIIR